MNKGLSAVLIAITAGLAACSDNTVAPRSEATDASTMQSGRWSDRSIDDVGHDPVQHHDRSAASDGVQSRSGELDHVPGALAVRSGPGRATAPANGTSRACRPASATTVQVKAWIDWKRPCACGFRQAPAVRADGESGGLGRADASPTSKRRSIRSSTSCTARKRQARCYDESKTDLSLLTVRNPLTGRVTRRIKHFSGYNVAAGRDDRDPSDGEMAASTWSLDDGSVLSVSTADLELDDLHGRRAGAPASERERGVHDARATFDLFASSPGTSWPPAETCRY